MPAPTRLAPPSSLRRQRSGRRARWWASVAAAALLVVSGCGEQRPQGPERGGGPASLTVAATVEAGGETASQQASSGGLRAAFEAADAAEVRLERASDGGVLVERSVPFDGAAGGAELSLEVTVEADRVPARLELTLARGPDPLFAGATGLTLVAGETATAEVALVAEPAAVVAEEGPVVFEALGDTAELAAAVVFATGDTIPGASVTWSSADPSVADVATDGTVVADAPGETEAVATHGDLSASVAVAVDPRVATVSVEPDAVTFDGLAQSAEFSVSVTDANGHPVEGEPVGWASTDRQVAAVDDRGVAEARGDGSARVVASAMGRADTATVTVELGPTGRVSGRVGRVRPPSSASVAASASDGASVGAAIATDPAGGVEVRFLRGGEVVSRTTTAGDGRWTSPAIPPAVYTLEYASPELATVRHAGVEIGEGTTGSVAEVPMVPASEVPGTVAGSVLNSRTGGGVARAAVEVREGLASPEGPVVATGTAGAEGGYEIPDVAAGTYTITAGAPDFAPAAITGVALGGEIFGGQDLALVPPPAVEIGSPIDGATFEGGALIPFRGSADDPEQGSLTGDALVWTSDQAGQIGTGESFTTTLPAGVHQITLTATNDRGASGEARVEIEVAEVPTVDLVEIDFETPNITTRQEEDPYVHQGSGTTFRTEPTRVLGLVENQNTSACVDPPSDDQTLGVGTEPGNIGFSSAPIEATFADPLPAGTQVSVEFQILAGTDVRLRLLDSAGETVGLAVVTAGPPDGTCGFPGDPRARTRVTAEATDPAVSAVMDELAGGNVFVLDDFRFGTNLPTEPAQ